MTNKNEKERYLNTATFRTGLTSIEVGHRVGHTWEITIVCIKICTSGTLARPSHACHVVYDAINIDSIHKNIPQKYNYSAIVSYEANSFILFTLLVCMKLHSLCGKISVIYYLSKLKNWHLV